MKNVNSYEAIAIQTKGLIDMVDDRFKTLTKKEAIRLLKYTLKFPVEHEYIDPKMLTKTQLEDLEFIEKIITSKNAMVITFVAENGGELQEIHNEVDQAKADYDAGIIPPMEEQIDVVRKLGGMGDELIPEKDESPEALAEELKEKEEDDLIQNAIDKKNAKKCDMNCDSCGCGGKDDL